MEVNEIMVNERGNIRGQSIKYRKIQTLMYHINEETLIKEHQRQSNNKASGIDKITKDKYEEKYLQSQCLYNHNIPQ